MHSHNPFWTFSVALYQLAPVRQACLQWQQDYLVDVNMLLYAVWQAHCRHRLSQEHFVLLIDEVERWRTETVLPLRQVRMSGRAKASGLPVSGQTEHFYTQVLALEIQAEQIQQNMMFEFAQNSMVTAVAENTTMDTLTSSNLTTYLKVHGGQFEMSERVEQKVTDLVQVMRQGYEQVSGAGKAGN